MMKIVLTGATGFVGRALYARLVDAEYDVLGVGGRVLSSGLDGANKITSVGEINGQTNWEGLLQGTDLVVHLAARAHILREDPGSSLERFRDTNVEGTLALAKQAIEAGVKRFVFISSIGVNGASTFAEPFSETSVPAPHADYAVSKFEAEQGLWKLVKGTRMEVVIIRPPLVYAAHAPGNFARLLRLVYSGVPLPFGLVNNQRSMIALENLVDFIALCIEHPAAANQIFLVSDGVEISTAEIVQPLAEGMGKKTYLLPVPVGLMRLVAKILGKQNMFEQLCGSLVIDSSKARELLGWQPPFDAHDALVQAGKRYSKE